MSEDPTIKDGWQVWAEFHKLFQLGQLERRAEQLGG